MWFLSMAFQKDYAEDDEANNGFRTSGTLNLFRGVHNTSVFIYTVHNLFREKMSYFQHKEAQFTKNKAIYLTLSLSSVHTTTGF